MSVLAGGEKGVGGIEREKCPGKSERETKTHRESVS